MTAKIKGVLFDKDGTLHGFQESWARPYLDLLQELSQGDPARLGKLAGVSQFDPDAVLFRPGSPVIAGTFEQMVGLISPLVPELGEGEVIARLERWAVEMRPTPVTDLIALFTQLREAGLWVGVATNDMEAAARAHLSDEIAAGVIDFVCGSDSGYGAKPAPGMIESFGRHAGLTGPELAMVGDSLHDLHAGRAAGAVCVAVLTGVAGREELAPHADHVFADVSALPGWLGID